MTGHLRDPPLQPVGCCLYLTGAGVLCVFCVFGVSCPFTVRDAFICIFFCLQSPHYSMSCLLNVPFI